MLAKDRISVDGMQYQQQRPATLACCNLGGDSDWLRLLWWLIGDCGNGLKYDVTRPQVTQLRTLLIYGDSKHLEGGSEWS